MVNHHNVWPERPCVLGMLSGTTRLISYSTVESNIFLSPKSVAVCRAWLCNFHSIGLVQQQQVLQHSLRPETTVRQRYNRHGINPHDREDYNQHTAKLAACITTVFVSNLMLLPSALAHGRRFNLEFFPLRSVSESEPFEGFTHLWHSFLSSAISFSASFCTNERSASEMMDFEARRKISLQLTVTSGMRQNRTEKTVHVKKKTFIDACRSELRNLAEETFPWKAS